MQILNEHSFSDEDLLIRIRGRTPEQTSGTICNLIAILVPLSFPLIVSYVWSGKLSEAEGEVLDSRQLHSFSVLPRTNLMVIVIIILNLLTNAVII